MGLFSWDCTFCGHPLLCPAATEKTNKWMADGVALLPHGALLVGTYDGYGRLNDADIGDAGEPQVYHKACWEMAGKPTKFERASRAAGDQGWFFEDEHNSPPPGKPGFFRAAKQKED